MHLKQLDGIWKDEVARTGIMEEYVSKQANEEHLMPVMGAVMMLAVIVMVIVVAVEATVEAAVVAVSAAVAMPAAVAAVAAMVAVLMVVMVALPLLQGKGHNIGGIFRLVLFGQNLAFIVSRYVQDLSNYMSRRRAPAATDDDDGEEEEEEEEEEEDQDKEMSWAIWKPRLDEVGVKSTD
ncbi:hypothetical protein CBR_g6615 [Chara braunii]|uniref:Uncharacterized protein n=1 Tax=Chara braunii TaxID=69332 RepID=A0A388KKD3_CHABU|nr:hypothetical protein CBR_g6615 [Chara braunii]|eukprot:GBG70486.1 hypothetical protein CBR_g6615 [Chara braunii]